MSWTAAGSRGRRVPRSPRRGSPRRRCPSRTRATRFWRRSRFSAPFAGRGWRLPPHRRRSMPSARRSQSLKPTCAARNALPAAACSNATSASADRRLSGLAIGVPFLTSHHLFAA